ncbi:unnamed protein product [Withania somnifera]
MDRLPTIDFRKGELKEGGEEWLSLREQVYKALEEYGCFEALLDGIPKESLFEKWKQVKDFPKFDINYTNPHNSPSFMPLYERLPVEHVLSPGVIENLSKTLWPDHGDPQFCDLLHCYAKELSKFDEMVRKMVFEKLDIFEKHWDEHKSSTSCAFAMLRYRVPKADETNLGLPPHTDKRITTILTSDIVGADGLQIMKKNGEWIDVEYSSPNSYMLFVGDILTALTNGRLQPACHRVITGNKKRYVMGFSATVKEGYIIKIAEELVDEYHPLLYKPFDASKYFQFVVDRNGNTLESFCGV